MNFSPGRDVGAPRGAAPGRRRPAPGPGGDLLSSVRPSVRPEKCHGVSFVSEASFSADVGKNVGMETFCQFQLNGPEWGGKRKEGWQNSRVPCRFSLFRHGADFATPQAVS